MELSEVCIIGIALAMDAFGVALGLSVSSSLKIENKIKFILSFAFFQFFFTYIGGVCGHLFDVYITSIPNVIGGIIMSIIGFLMIIDGIKEKEDNFLIKNSTCIILGISVSIDALVIGFTAFHIMNNQLILFSNSFLIGIITFIFTSISFILGRFVKQIYFVEKYANFLGGLALVVFGIKMMLF